MNVVIVIIVVVLTCIGLIAIFFPNLIQNEFLERQFDKMNDSFYKDDEETNIHVPISFFLSNVSTISLYVVVVLFTIKNAAFFVN